MGKREEKTMLRWVNIDLRTLHIVMVSAVFGDVILQQNMFFPKTDTMG
ncbi:MAG: hypothetical protein HQQ73_04825 [Desulfobulbaceae bacterium]|nr:hypothetical protein [Desulfobulbaceae bacterium]